MNIKIINNPSNQDGLELFSEFECSPTDFIALSKEDFINTIINASKAIVVESSASGKERLKEAISRIENIIKDVAPNLTLFSANKVLCLVVISKDFNFKEMNHLTEFFKNFSNETDIIWGVTRKKKDDINDVTTRFLISFN